MELFSKVKAGPLLDMTPKTDMSFWKSGKLYKLEAVRDLHSLILSWTLPCLHKEYMKKPEDYLAHLLGHGKWLSTHSLSSLLFNEVNIA
jgi:nardilysin